MILELAAVVDNEAHIRWRDARARQRLLSRRCAHRRGMIVGPRYIHLRDTELIADYLVGDTAQGRNLVVITYLCGQVRSPPRQTNLDHSLLISPAETCLDFSW